MAIVNPLVPVNPQVPVVDADGIPSQAFYRFTQRASSSIVPGGAFANLPSIPTVGMLYLVTDSTTTTWGATVAGGGANTVLVWFNGSVWTVTAK